MACVAVTSLMRTIELEFMQPQPRPIVQQKELFSCNKDLIQSLHQKLGSLMELFDEKRMDGVEAIKHLETKLRDVAFRVEDEIEFQVAHLYVDKEEKQGDTDAEKKLPFLRLRHILEQSIEDIDAIKEELVKVNMEYKHAIASQGRKTTLDAFTKSDEVLVTGDFSRHASHSEDSMVGKNNDFKTIKEMLIKHPSKQREVVSIEGMGGIGKTTLARRVYEDHTVASHFDNKQAWVVASQLHNKRQMLVSLLNSMGDEESESDERDEEFSLQRKKSDEKLALQLYKRLKCQRYLVVMDDVWSRDAWDVVKACFPDDRNGSRLLMTTRLAEVANYIRFDNDFSLQMQLLNQSESWNLFCDKVGRSCSAEFEMIGRPIVEKCKGLPLAIIVVAGLFSKLNTLDEWKNIAKTLNSLAKTTVDEECSRILSLSYNHLLHNLKACFLYLGVFPEDHESNVNELARLWSAEGLLKAFKDESFDVVAKRYIQELMDRNLILVSKRSCCGRKIKAFKMHDLLHAFCVKEAQNENLLYVAPKYGIHLPVQSFRWLSIQELDCFTPTIYSSSKSCRSIFNFAWGSLDLKSFNLLRVLYFTYGSNTGMCKDIVDLVHLRYLPPVVKNNKISNLFKAWNLQTLSILADDERNYLKCPKLQYIYCYSICRHPPKFVHRNLQSISWLKPYHCTKEFLRVIPNLKKVRIRGDGRDFNDLIENLACLHQLERLYILYTYDDSYRHTVSINNNIVLLKNLKKVSFTRTGFEWNEINVLSKLPRLEVLKLFISACIGEKWELSDKEKFCHLIVLEINGSDLKHWKASSDNFPKLERLMLYCCPQLEVIPTDFVEISTLKSIELTKCLPSVVTSAKQIQEDQHDYGNDAMIVIEKATIHSRGSKEDSVAAISNSSKRKWGVESE